MTWHVIRWTNGMVSVYDSNGDQLPDFQGKYEEVAARVLEQAPEGTRFSVSKWGAGGVNHQHVEVSRTAWAYLGNHQTPCAHRWRDPKNKIIGSRRVCEDCTAQDEWAVGGWKELLR